MSSPTPSSSSSVNSLLTEQDLNSVVCDEEMEELIKLREMTKSSSPITTEDIKKFVPPTAEEQKEADSRSVHMSNVDWNSTVKEIEEFFKGIGEIKRVTIPKCKMTGRQKNFAFIEFASAEDMDMALVMSGAQFRGRTVTVVPKRTNKPGMGQQQQKPFMITRACPGGAAWGGRGGSRGRGGPLRPNRPTMIKYVYVNQPARPRGNMSKRFAPY